MNSQEVLETIKKQTTIKKTSDALIKTEQNKKEDELDKITNEIGLKIQRGGF